MRKILVLATTAIVIGVVIAGSGVIGLIEPQSVKTAKDHGFVSICMESNASFLAPMPINYSINQVYSPTPRHVSMETRIILTD